MWGIKWNGTFQLTWNEDYFNLFIYSHLPCPGLCYFFVESSVFSVCFFLLWCETVVQNPNGFWDGPYLLQCGTSARIQLQQSRPQLAVAGADGKFTRVCSCTRSDGCAESLPKVSVFSSRGGRYKLWVAFVLWLHQGMLIMNSAPSVMGTLCVSQHPRPQSPNGVGSLWVPSLVGESKSTSMIRCGVGGHTWMGLFEMVLLCRYWKSFISGHLSIALVGIRPWALQGWEQLTRFMQLKSRSGFLA